MELAISPATLVKIVDHVVSVTALLKCGSTVVRRDEQILDITVLQYPDQNHTYFRVRSWTCLQDKP